MTITCTFLYYFQSYKVQVSIMTHSATETFLIRLQFPNFCLIQNVIFINSWHKSSDRRTVKFYPFPIILTFRIPQAQRSFPKDPHPYILWRLNPISFKMRHCVRSIGLLHQFPSQRVLQYKSFKCRSVYALLIRTCTAFYYQFINS